MFYIAVFLLLLLFYIILFQISLYIPFPFFIKNSFLLKTLFICFLFLYVFYLYFYILICLFFNYVNDILFNDIFY